MPGRTRTRGFWLEVRVLDSCGVKLGKWRGRRDSNPRRPAWKQACRLSPELAQNQLSLVTLITPVWLSPYRSTYGPNYGILGRGTKLFPGRQWITHFVSQRLIALLTGQNTLFFARHCLGKYRENPREYPERYARGVSGHYLRDSTDLSDRFPLFPADTSLY